MQVLTVSCAVKHTLSDITTTEYEMDRLSAVAVYHVSLAAKNSVALTKYVAYTSSLDVPPTGQHGFCEQVLRPAADRLAVLLAEQRRAMYTLENDVAVDFLARGRCVHLEQAGGTYEEAL